MAYAIRFKASAVSELMQVPRHLRRRFDIGFDQMQESPFRSVPGVLSVHQMRGGRGLWTMVVGPYRGIYRVVGDEVRFLAFRARPIAYRDVTKL